MECETFIKQMLKTYAVPQGTENLDEGKVLQGKFRLLADVGAHMLKVGGLLEAEKAQRAVLPPERRDQIVEKAGKNAFFHVETKFAGKMLNANAFTKATLPEQLYKKTKEDDEDDEDEKETKAGKKSKDPLKDIRVVSLDEQGKIALSDDDLKTRLGFEKLPAKVMLRPNAEIVKQEGEGSSDGDIPRLVTSVSINYPSAEGTQQEGLARRDYGSGLR